ncbi:hypothetical protein HJ01_01925 [Flavobacterium frigoris PS1]|uniref:Uncharacterized protein n=1 Tax=Flavobacterium frigoris (strain PS1) TaxID=1086011 RepID=H7FRR3_FLAFP|nr:hypothetical protein HJ01_01925 [Flavobacterium frigoris PS1]
MFNLKIILINTHLANYMPIQLLETNQKLTRLKTMIYKKVV